MSPGILSDKRAVAAIIIGAILAIVAYVFIRPIDRTVSYAVYGVALLLFVYAYVMDISDEIAPTAKPKSKPKTKPMVKDVPKPVDKHAEEYVPAVKTPAAKLSKLPIETIEGIGGVYGKELRAVGILTVADLMAAKADTVARACDVSKTQAERWIAMSKLAWLDEVSEEDAEAIVFATGITDLRGLAAASADDMYRKIKTALEKGDVRVPSGYKFSTEKIQAWIDAAKRMV